MFFPEKVMNIFLQKFQTLEITPQTKFFEKKEKIIKENYVQICSEIRDLSQKI